MFGNLFGKKPPSGPNGPDFSGVDTPEKVQKLVAEGRLEKLLLLPEMFGGDDAPHNVVYVPVGLAQFKASTDENVILPLAQDGKVSHYTAKPAYVDGSHVPIKVEVSATDPGSFTFTLKCWGEGLNDDA